MAAIDLGIATGVLATFLGTDPINVGATPEQKKDWLKALAEHGHFYAYGATEPQAGSDLGALATTAVPVEDGGKVVGYRISGRKQWISNGGVADRYTILANAPGGTSWFLVDKGAEGFTAGKPEDKHGIRASNTAALFLENVYVPADRLIGLVEGKGLAQAHDNCPFFPHWDRTDSDGDGLGNPCDNCVSVSNPLQENGDGDPHADACDNCPGVASASLLDSDADSVGPDACDNCQEVGNSDQLDSDGDAAGNACDPCPLDAVNDADSDGICGNADNCPDVFNPDQADSDVGPFDGQWASSASASSEYSPSAWSASRATGRPDVVGCSDSELAWSPLDSGVAPEWLETRYPMAVQATGVRVVESWSAPFVTRIELIDDGGSYHTVWEGADATACGGTLAIDYAPTGYSAIGVRITTAVDGWEAIDAVRLVGEGFGPAPDGVGDACDAD